MKRIESFCVNHNKLKKGLYLSRVDGDAVTYDLRMAIPNSGTYLENDGIHTFEHLFATYARNSAYSDRVIYVGPMGFISSSGTRSRLRRSSGFCRRPWTSSPDTRGRSPAFPRRNAAITGSTASRRQRNMQRIWRRS